MKSITLGGGCFWCIETCFRKVKGVVSAISGYAGGEKESANYKKVCSGQTNHVEVVQVKYDTQIIESKKILEAFFLMHDPTQLNRQGNDIGYQYSSVIFYNDEEQKKLAEEVIQKMNKEIYDDKIVTKLIKLQQFYPAEDYHQDYFENNPQNPYCSVVIKPKLAKFRKEFLDKWSNQLKHKYIILHQISQNNKKIYKKQYQHKYIFKLVKKILIIIQFHHLINFIQQ